MARQHIVALALSIALGACASVPAGQSGNEADPLEPMNRAVFEFNMALDRVAIEPAARAYRSVVPQFARDRFRAFMDNLAEPRIFVNDLLQGRGEAASTTFARFFINTVAGLGGLFDQATPAGYARQSGDFGQTLYAWGAGEGPYVVLPFFGPSNVRDALGLGIDVYSTPPAHVLGGEDASQAEFALGAVDGIDLRERNLEALEEIKKSALDLYTHLRSLWLQHRRAQLREGRGEKVEPEELLDPEAPPK